MYSAENTIWVLVAAALVFFMQAGFAMVETGFTRAKNAGNIIMKNLMDFSLGTPIYWLLGFGIMFGGSSALIGGFDPMVKGDYSSILPSGVPLMAFLIFQTVFCATAATIVSGAMAERTKFSAYCIYSMVISAIIYPVSGHWIWGGGWLAQLGFHDFAGSTAVHMVGGVAAFIGAKILGPRIGKYDKNGKSKAIPGHSLTLGALGVFILWFCWFGFNGGSTVSATGDDVLASMGNIFVTTNMAAAVATVTVMCITWIRYKKPDVSMTLNGSLAGLVAITAGCDLVTPFGAALIGIIAGFIVVFGIEFIDKKLKVDDPVGAVGVHGLCGAGGTIMVGLFAQEQGLFYGGGASLLLTQVIGVIAVIAWVTVAITITFQIIKHTIGLRVTKEEEILGLDIEEHGLTSAYADFMPTVDVISEIQNKPSAPYAAPVERAVPVSKVGYSGPSADGSKFTTIVIIAKQSKFEVLKQAMNAIGVTGMTVTNVLGCGIQKGATEFYRGVPLEMNLLPKVKVEITVCKVPVDLVVEEAKKALYTGNIGDGKIFVYDVEDVIKVRTGETGCDALQDEE
ncbi:ammonium transporter [Anaerocolumna sp. AGMB13025]|uniref:ammonium transporter n=1 Tax=Anaerocolumna sp. AGMB13025 TaxID=3039116 RepID=UPI00241EB80D|nr:ammonium transporter [Anaerocolumna sp. AGMB13025]WFR55330.1 ammonium transporter [Anaerocolumna sp. AGMB13025]